MRAHARVIAPALPLVYALRLSWAEPKALFSAARRIPAFSTAAAQTFTNLRDTGHSKPRGTWQLLPWAHALPLDVPAPSRKPPGVMDGMRKDVGKGFTLPGMYVGAWRTGCAEYPICGPCFGAPFVHGVVRRPMHFVIGKSTLVRCYASGISSFFVPLANVTAV